MKGESDKLREIFKHSDRSEEEFVKKIDETVIDASEMFKSKVKYDKWWKKALERVNNVGKPPKNDKKVKKTTEKDE
jgi:hypothetical protein